MPAAVTLRDIAAAAGVSISSVSRALDERLPAGDGAAARRIREIATELGYRRNVAASSLRRASTGTVGVLVPRLTDTVMATLFEAVFAEALRRDRFALVSVAGDDPATERRAAEALLARQVDGLLLASSRVDDTLPGDLRAREVPHVLLLRTDGVSPSSVGDDELGGYLATRHLLDLGHRRIGLIAGPWFTSTARGRAAGFRRAMTEAGLPVDDRWVRSGGYGLDDGERLAAELLADAGDRPTAIFAMNDNLAIGVTAAAERAGLRIGVDLSLVGYNDIPIAARLAVPLTTVRVPFDRIAATAFDLLAGRDPGSTVAAPTLIPRRSTGPAA